MNNVTQKIYNLKHLIFLQHFYFSKFYTRIIGIRSS